MNVKDYICNGKELLQNRLLGYKNEVNKFDLMYNEMVDKFCQFDICYKLLCLKREEVDSKLRING